MIRLASIAITSCLTMLIAGCGDKPRTDIAADTTRHTGPAGSEGMVNAGDSVQLLYRMCGSGPDTIIVLHGGPGFTADYLAADLEPLAERHTLFFYDQRGTGKSTLVTDSAALAGPRFAEDVEAIRVHFGMDRVILLGHSWGTGVAALYGERFPERVGKLILVGSMPLTRKGLTDAFEELASSRDSAETRRMEEAMAEVARESGAGFFRLSEPFGKAVRSTPEPLFATEGHCNDRGYEVMAGLVADDLLAREPTAGRR